MSILVKGMNKPDSCAACPFERNGWPDEWEMHCKLLGRQVGYFDKKNKVPKDCPLVEIPTPHGRLIDADELKNWIYAWFTMHRNYHPYSKSNLIPSTEIVDIIDRLPTIIEAEEGE